MHENWESSAIVIGVALAMLTVTLPTAVATHNSFGAHVDIVESSEVEPGSGDLQPDIAENGWMHENHNHFNLYLENLHVPPRPGPVDQTGSSYTDCNSYAYYLENHPDAPLKNYEHDLPGYEHPELPSDEASDEACYVGYLDRQVQYIMVMTWAGGGFTGINTDHNRPDQLYHLNPHPSDGECERGDWFEDEARNQIESDYERQCPEPTSNPNTANTGHKMYGPTGFNTLTIDTHLVETAFGGQSADTQCEGPASCDGSPVIDSFDESERDYYGSGTLTLPHLWTSHIFLLGYPHPTNDNPSPVSAESDVFDLPQIGVPDSACGTLDGDNARTPPGDECRLLTPKDLEEYDIEWREEADINAEQAGRLCEYDPGVGIINAAGANEQPCGPLGSITPRFNDAHTAGGLVMAENEDGEYEPAAAPTYVSTVPGWKSLTAQLPYGNLQWANVLAFDATFGPPEDENAGTRMEARSYVAVNPHPQQFEYSTWCAAPNLATSGSTINDAKSWGDWTSNLENDVIPSSDDWENVSATFEVEITSDPDPDGETLSEDGVTIEGITSEEAPMTTAQNITLSFQEIDDLIGANAWLNVTEPNGDVTPVVDGETVDETFTIDTSLLLDEEGTHELDVETNSTELAAFFAVEFDAVGSFQELGELPAPKFYGDYQAAAIDVDIHPTAVRGPVYEAWWEGNGVPAYEGQEATRQPVFDAVDEVTGQTEEVSDTLFETANDVLDEAETVEEIVNELQDDVDQVASDAEDALEPVRERVDDSTDRFALRTGSDPDPVRNPGEDNYEQFTETWEEGIRCTPSGNVWFSEDGLEFQGALRYGVSVTESDVSVQTGLAGVSLGVPALQDPTFTNPDGEPARESNTSWGAWNAVEYSFNGPLHAYVDRQASGSFSGCGTPDGTPDPNDDACPWFPTWDVFNPNCLADDEEGTPCAEVLEEDGFRTDESIHGAEAEDDPGEPYGNGLLAVLEVTGTVKFEHADDGTAEALERQIYHDGDPSQTLCAIMTSERFHEDDKLPRHVDQIDPNTEVLTMEDAEAFLCSEDADTIVHFEDAFDGQGSPGGTGWSSDISWTKLTPTPEATEDEVANDDRDVLCNSVVFSTKAGLEEGVNGTRTNVQLGADTDENGNYLTETYYTNCVPLSQRYHEDGEPTQLHPLDVKTHTLPNLASDKHLHLE